MRSIPGLLVALIILPALAGCLAEQAPETDHTPGELTPGPLPIDARGPLTGSAVGREPALASTGQGARLVAAWSGAEDEDGAIGPLVWRSLNAGGSWERLQAGEPSDGAAGNSDVDLAVGPEGTIYLAQLTFAPVFEPTGTLQPPVFGSGTSIVVGASEDGGDTWSWTVPVRGPMVDRPWIEVDPGGTVHLVWNDPDGVHHATSTDRGATFEQGPMVHPEGGDGGFDIGPEGELAVRVVPPHAHGYVVAEGADGVAVSTDGGQTWRFEALPGERSWSSGVASSEEGDGVPRLWDPIAFDPAGTLYAAWSEGSSLVAARSTDLGSSWSSAIVLEQPGQQLFFPFLHGGPGASNVTATWFSQAEDGTLSAWAAQVAWTDEVSASWGMLSEGTNGTWGEYLEVEYTPDGTAWVVVPVDRGDGPVLHLYDIAPPR